MIFRWSIEFLDCENTLRTQIFHFIVNITLHIIVKCSKTGFLDFRPFKNVEHGKLFIPVCRRSEALIKCQKRISKLFDIF